MDARKWVERKAAIAIGESGTSSDVKLIADTYTPTITKLVECLDRLRKEAGALIAAHEIALRQDSGNTNIACLQLRIDEAQNALAELEKP